MAKIISFTSGKGGSGKTLCSVNFAAELVSRGYKVLLFDMDINCSNVFILLHVKPGNAFQKYFEGVIDLKETIQPSQSGVDIVSAGVNILRFIQFENDYNLNKLLNDIESLKDMYDFIIFDHAAGISQNMMRFYAASDEIVLVGNPEVTALTDLYRMIKVISANKLCERLSLIVNKVRNIDWAVNLYREIVKVMQKFKLEEKLYLLGPILNDEEKVLMSIQKRTPIIKLFPKTPIKGGFSLAVTRFLYNNGIIKDADSKDKAFADFF